MRFASIFKSESVEGNSRRTTLFSAARAVASACVAAMFPQIAPRNDAASASVPLPPPPPGFFPSLPSLPGRGDLMNLGKGLSRTVSYTSHHSSHTSLHSKPRKRRNKILPTSSFAPVCAAGGERFAETVYEKDLRRVPGPGSYVNTVGLGRPQFDAQYRSHRVSAFGPPLQPGSSRQSKASHANVRVHKRLLSHKKMVQTLASMWDLDRDGLVGRRELSRGMLMLGVQLSEADLDVLFDTYDTNHDGGIDLQELSAAVERGGGLEGVGISVYEHQLQQEGHKGGIAAMEREGNRKKRGGRTKALGSFQFHEGNGKPIQEQLRDALAKRAGRVLDVFRDFDTTQNGLISKAEFRAGLQELGYGGEPSAITALFKEWDADGSGAISLVELSKILRRGGNIQIKSLEAAAHTHAQEKQRQVLKQAAGIANRVNSTLQRRSKEQFQRRSKEKTEGTAALDRDQEKLLKRLASKKEKLLKNLSMWDANGDGFISKQELRHALPVVGVMADDSTIDALFDTMDYNHAGKVSFEHLDRAIRWACKSQKSSVMQAKVQDDGRPMHEQLRDALAGASTRVIDLFREWDENGDGEISREEFSRALPMLGIACPKEAQEALFTEFDSSGSGALSFKDFNKLLRRNPAAEDAEAKRKKAMMTQAPVVEILSLTQVRQQVAREVAKLEATMDAAKANKKEEYPW